ncbi:putative EAL domain-containing protein [Pseudomonas aeruginosa VRFPA02]|nr:putative EAL domain-containing protein [Pseudomonas aeruginosa VRFPA02]
MNGSPQARQHEHPPAVAASLAGDLRLARRFQAALARGRVRLDWQAVRHAGHPEWEPLYRETLLRVTAASGEPPLPTQELILALERLGLVRLLDRCVLGTVLDRLNAEPTLRLACNLSRQSAAMDAWWEAVCRWLAARPQVARRLTLELTETAVGERVATREFIRRLREHGVRIAIDDFGAAHNNLDFVLDARPDVIKIDCRYTREARRSAKGAEVLRHLLALCRELAPCVVLEGLEEDDAFARLPTGDVYLQGNAIAPPMRVEPPLSVRRPKSRARIEALAGVTGEGARPGTVGEKSERSAGGAVTAATMPRCVVPKSRHFFPVTPTESTMNRAISLPLKGAAWLLLVLALPFANAQDMNKTAPQTFVSEASAAGVAEIEAGKMALEKSTAADVKVFAKQMIDDHGKVNAELRSLAERKKLEVEDDASLTDKAKATLLDLRDASFDPAYANNQVAAHEKAVELFTQAADNLTDPELQAFAKTHLPALKHHLEMARALAKAHPSK